MIKYGNCSHCNVPVVVGSDEYVKGYEHGCEPVWIWDKKKKEFERNYTDKFLCLECANTKITR